LFSQQVPSLQHLPWLQQEPSLHLPSAHFPSLPHSLPLQARVAPLHDPLQHLPEARLPSLLVPLVNVMETLDA
jgi:hypothetical protein